MERVDAHDAFAPLTSFPASNQGSGERFSRSAEGPPAYDKPPCASLDGFTLHAATRAGGQKRVEHQPNGVVRITLRKAPYRSSLEASARLSGRRRE